MWVVECQLLFARTGLLTFQLHGGRNCLAHLLAVGIQQSLFYLARLVVECGVVYFRLDTDGGRTVRRFQVGIDKRTEGSHAHLARLDEPGIAIDTATLVEPAFFQ